ncbi:sialin-like [Euwallacea fornicatus]|uniref:sialin-like n=1 Tax=Euwallacea fornicatus TaxID=995702 RepID=UPI00338D723E
MSALKIKKSPLIPMRSIIWLMLFTCTLVLYVLRTNMSLILIAMVNTTPSNATAAAVPECAVLNKDNSSISDNETSISTERRIGRKYSVTYGWDSRLQGLILGAYFWGFVLSNIPGAAVAERFGPRKSVAVSFALSALLTLLGPLCASWHPYWLIASRFLIGLFGGIVYPAVHCLISRWAPPAEKGKFISATLGGSLGTVVTWPLLGNVIEHVGWEWGFYISGILVLVWTFFWIVAVYDCPEKHPWIGSCEKDYIVNGLSGTLSSKKSIPPYKSILTSLPVWALGVAQFGNLWGLFFLMTAGPKFMSTVLGFDLGNTGFLAAVPYLARMLAGFVFGIIGDSIIRRGSISKSAIRKSFTVFSHIVPGLLLVGQTFVGCQATWVISLIALSLASNGASTITNLSNAQDLAPNFAGSLYGIVNCLGSTTGFLSPMLVGYLTADHNGMEEWHTIFYIGAIVYVFCGLFFAIFGSGEIQHWNRCEGDEDCPDVKPVRHGIDNRGFDGTTEDKV